MRRWRCFPGLPKLHRAVVKSNNSNNQAMATRLGFGLHGIQVNNERVLPYVVAARMLLLLLLLLLHGRCSCC